MVETWGTAMRRQWVVQLLVVCCYQCWHQKHRRTASITTISIGLHLMIAKAAAAAAAVEAVEAVEAVV